MGKPTIITGKAGTTDIQDVSIDTEAWLEAVLGQPIDIDDDRCGLSDTEALAADEGWDNGPLARYAAENLLSVELNTSVQCVEAVRDNVYNGENQFSQQFTFTVYTPSDSPDWAYGDCVVAVCLHRGGDVRCNYGQVALYQCNGLADSGFLDWVVGWHIASQDSPLDGVFNTDRWSIGYTGHPTSELESMIMDHKSLTWRDELGEWTELGTYRIEVDGEVLEVAPHLNV